jgi:hypothetical protein
MKVNVTELVQIHRCEAQAAYDAARGRKRSGAWEQSRLEGVAAHRRLEGRTYSAKGHGKQADQIVKAAAALLFVLFYLFFGPGGR